MASSSQRDHGTPQTIDRVFFVGKLNNFSNHFQSVLAADKKPLIADPFFEKVIRLHIKKPAGELTKADLEKVRRLSLFNTQITDAGLKELAKCKQLRELYPRFSKVTKAGVAQLQKALPKCKVDWP